MANEPAKRPVRKATKEPTREERRAALKKRMADPMEPVEKPTEEDMRRAFAERMNSPMEVVRRGPAPTKKTTGEPEFDEDARKKS